MKLRTIFFLSLVTVLLAATIVAVPARSAPMAQAQTGAAGDPVSKGPATQEQAAATLAYWTPERMADAQPMDITLDAAPDHTFGPASAAAPAGDPGSAPGNKPGQDPGTVAVPELTGIPQPATSAWYSYPYPYIWTYASGGLQDVYTMSTQGKLFFTQYGVNYVCSGTSTTSGSGGNASIVMTAGHCLHAGDNSIGGWSYNVEFCPRYDHGNYPVGCWVDYDDWTESAWYSSADLRHDWGIMVAQSTSFYGYGRLGNVVGTQGFAWNQGNPWEFWSWGYPAQSPFNGSTLVWVSSSTAVTDAPNGLAGPDAIGIGSNMTGGASGGAWIIQQRLSTPGYVISHNDYKYTTPSMPLAMFGPYSDTDTQTLWNTARVEAVP